MYRIPNDLLRHWQMICMHRPELKVFSWERNLHEPEIHELSGLSHIFRYTPVGNSYEFFPGFELFAENGDLIMGPSYNYRMIGDKLWKAILRENERENKAMHVDLDRLIKQLQKAKANNEPVFLSGDIRVLRKGRIRILETSGILADL